MKNTTAAIEEFAKTVAKLTKEQAQANAPKHIAPHIVSSVGGSRAKGYKITVAVTKVPTETTDGTDDAFAQEYGSGMRGKNKKPVIIKAVRKKALAFISNNPLVIQYSKSQKKRGRAVIPLAQSVRTRRAVKSSIEGKIILVRKPRVVHHPGIFPYRGEGFMRPAIKSARELILTFPTKLSSHVKLDVIEQFKGFGKKR